MNRCAMPAHEVKNAPQNPELRRTFHESPLLTCGQFAWETNMTGPRVEDHRRTPHPPPQSSGRGQSFRLALQFRLSLRRNGRWKVYRKNGKSGFEAYGSGFVNC